MWEKLAGLRLFGSVQRLSGDGHMDCVILVRQWPHRAGGEVWESWRTETDGSFFSFRRENALHCFSVIQSPLIFFFPVGSEGLRNIWFQWPLHGHNTWTGVRSKARGDQGTEDSSPCLWRWLGWVCYCLHSVIWVRVPFSIICPRPSSRFLQFDGFDLWNFPTWPIMS